MSHRSFTITSASPEAALDGQGKAAAVFTATNVMARPVRGQIRIQPLGATDPSWLKLAENEEHHFAASESLPITVEIHPSSGAPAGKYNFRVDICATSNPDDDFTQGPTSSFTIPETSAPPPAPKAFPLWLLLVILAVVLAGGAWLALSILKKPSAPTFMVRLISDPNILDEDHVSYRASVSTGRLKKDEKVDVVGRRRTVAAVVSKITEGGEEKPEATTQDRALYLTFKGEFEGENIEGLVVAPRGTIRIYRKFKAEIELTERLITASRNDAPLQFNLSSLTPGTLFLKDDARAGLKVSAEIFLSGPVVTPTGSTFDIFDSADSQIATGTVVKVIE